MRVPDTIANGAVFIGTLDRGKPRWKGTAFFASIETEFSEHLYLVAPWHIIKKFSGEWCTRVNTKAGGSKLISSRSTRWYRHPYDKYADVALHEWPDDPDQDLYYCPAYMLLTPEIETKESVAAGDDLVIISLFTRAIKDPQCNNPIVRSGTLSVSPPIPFPVRDPDDPNNQPSGSTELYLAETRSFGGISGSPVYVFVSIQFKDNKYVFDPLGPCYLLGMMRSHWNIPEDQLDEYDFATKEGINLGISLVTPAYKILETLNQSVLVERRAEIDAKRYGIVDDTK